MIDLTPMDVACRYFVNDLPGATIPATRLRNILDSLRQGRQVTANALNYMQEQGLIALHRFARGEITYEAFCEAAEAERATREKSAKAARLASEAEQKCREAAWAAKYELERQRAEETRRAQESDPKYIAKVKIQRLRARYGLEDFIEKPFFSRLMEVLHRIDGGKRFTDEDVLWLTTEGKNYYSDILQAAFHKREAEFYAAEYKRTNDPWMAVNASGHYRKCDQAKQAHDLLMSIPDERQKAPKLKSAICTTHGGALRDLMRREEALQLGNQAHKLTPKDFRPCTLLGAIHVELGNYGIAMEWFEKATERGASERSIDTDLRSIFLRAEKAKREEIKLFLLREDPVRYRWVNHVGK